MKLQVGDVVAMKKNHPCGGNEWRILRTGVDFRLRCETCGHLVLIPRPKLLKAVRRVVLSGESLPAEQPTD